MICAATIILLGLGNGGVPVGVTFATCPLVVPDTCYIEFQPTPLGRDYVVRCIKHDTFVYAGTVTRTLPT